MGTGPPFLLLLQLSEKYSTALGRLEEPEEGWGGGCGERERERTHTCAHKQEGVHMRMNSNNKEVKINFKSSREVVTFL